MTFAHWLISALAIILTSYLLPGATVTLIGALVLAVVLALINAFLRPLILALTLPINVVTLGLFSLVINAVLVLLAARIVPGFELAGFWSALWFSIILSLINTLFFWSNESRHPTTVAV